MISLSLLRIRLLVGLPVLLGLVYLCFRQQIVKMPISKGGAGLQSQTPVIQNQTPVKDQTEATISPTTVELMETTLHQHLVSIRNEKNAKKRNKLLFDISEKVEYESIARYLSPDEARYVLAGDVSRRSLRNTDPSYQVEVVKLLADGDWDELIQHGIDNVVQDYRINNTSDALNLLCDISCDENRDYVISVMIQVAYHQSEKFFNWLRNVQNSELKIAIMDRIKLSIPKNKIPIDFESYK